MNRNRGGWPINNRPDPEGTRANLSAWHAPGRLAGGPAADQGVRPTSEAV